MKHSNIISPGKQNSKFGGYGRGMDNKMSRTTKHKLDRIVDKRRRRFGKIQCNLIDE